MIAHWIGYEAVAMARTPGQTGPGFESWIIEGAAALIPASRLGGEFYLTRETVPYCNRTSWEWRIWDQHGICHAQRLTQPVTEAA